MKIPGLEQYEFETELSQVSFHGPIKASRSSHVMASGVADEKTQLLLDASNEMVAVLRWNNATDRAAKKQPAVGLVPFSNIASMVPVLTPPVAASGKGKAA